MIPYFIVLLIVLLLASFLNKNFKNSINNKIILFIIFLILVLFQGFRDSSVGTDTKTYVNSFLGISDFADYYFNDTPSPYEIGYVFVQKIASIFSNNYFSLLLTVSIIVVLFQLKSIYELSLSPTISIFVLITFGIYTFSFNGIRQGIAAAIYMYSIRYIVERNFNKHAFWIFVGFLFHKTIIITLPLYFIFKRRFTLKLFIILLFASIISSVFFSQLVNVGANIISDKYKIYIEAEESGGKLLTLLYTILSIVFIVFRYKLRIVNIKLYDVLLNMFIIASMIYLIVFMSSAYIELTRLGFYFLISTVFIWPIIFKSASKNFYPVLFVFFVSIHLLFFYIYLSKMSGLIPYKFNSELLSNLF